MKKFLKIWAICLAVAMITFLIISTLCYFFVWAFASYPSIVTVCIILGATASLAWVVKDEL